VLIPACPQRLVTSLPGLFRELEAQCANFPGEAEVLVLLDNETISIGEKINLLVENARGRFVSVVADDDGVRHDYVPKLLRAIDEAPDAEVICFDCSYIVDRDAVQTIKEGKDYGDRTEGDVHFRNPSDKMCWRRDFRLALPCVHTWETSDTDFSRRANPLISKEHRIDEELYIYHFDSKSPIGSRYREQLDRTRGRWRE
jgi:hypothetical protein